MHLGIFSYNVEYGARPDELARAAEERGFESFWVGEHTHIPASRRTPYPGGEPLPKPYYHMADPFVSLMAAAAATRTIKLGTGICLVVEHDPIVLAKSVATLDWLSNGRVLFGIGGGWNREEMEHHGTPFDRRWQVLRERVLAMKALWTQDEASFHGEFVNFDRAISFPKPVQRPHPPILFGGATAQGRARVVEYCDGWIPIDVLLDDLPAAITDLRRRAEAAAGGSTRSRSRSSRSGLPNPTPSPACGAWESSASPWWPRGAWPTPCPSSTAWRASSRSPCTR